MGVLKNLRGNRLAENIDRRYLIFKKEKEQWNRKKKKKKNRINVSINIKFQNHYLLSAVLNCKGEGGIWHFVFLRFLQCNIT